MLWKFNCGLENIAEHAKEVSCYIIIPSTENRGRKRDNFPDGRLWCKKHYGRKIDPPPIDHNEMRQITVCRVTLILQLHFLYEKKTGTSLHYYFVMFKVLRYFRIFKYFSKSVWKIFQIVRKLLRVPGNFLECLEIFQRFWKLSRIQTIFQIVQRLSILSVKFLECPQTFLRFRKHSRMTGNCTKFTEIFQSIRKLSKVT